MKKILIIGLAIGIITLGYVYLKPTKKPCGCGASRNPSDAVDQMTEDELKDQISKYSTVDTTGKNIDELRTLLKSFIS